MTVQLNIGSNLGDRPANLARAVALLIDAFAPAGWRLSAPVESEPWGFDSPHPFLNRGLRLDFVNDLDPEAVLDITQAVERAISPDSHRNPDGSYRDRLVDIDIITIDRLRLATPRLTLPHPHMQARPFVMGPWLELGGWGRT